jgi:phosphate-selective porin OprO and OprP
MLNTNLLRRFAVAVLALAFFGSAHAVTVYEKDDKRIDVGARIQIEYMRVSPDCAPGVACLIEDDGTVSPLDNDDLFFRRLRPYISGTLFKDWFGKVEFDFGEAEDTNEVQIKDAYFTYSGFKGGLLYLGNSKTVFAREFLTSSAELELVERGFTGDHNVGVPDRMLGVRWDGKLFEGKVSYAANVGAQNHDPAVNRMDFDTPVNNQADWNEGMEFAARIDVHPLGKAVPWSQGDLERGPSRLSAGIGAFYWSNDGDNNTYTDPITGANLDPDRPDLDEADGIEISAAYRGHGVSVDVAKQVVDGDTVDPTFTGGLYLNGETQLEKLAIVGGYMVWKDALEVVAGWETQDADNYQDEYERTSLGLNWYLQGHKLKIQATYRRVDNFIGLTGQKQDVWFGSTQYVF